MAARIWKRNYLLTDEDGVLHAERSSLLLTQTDGTSCALHNQFKSSICTLETCVSSYSALHRSSLHTNGTRLCFMTSFIKLSLRSSFHTTVCVVHSVRYNYIAILSRPGDTSNVPSDLPWLVPCVLCSQCLICWCEFISCVILQPRIMWCTPSAAGDWGGVSMGHRSLTKGWNLIQGPWNPAWRLHFWFCSVDTSEDFDRTIFHLLVQRFWKLVVVVYISIVDVAVSDVWKYRLQVTSEW